MTPPSTPDLCIAELGGAEITAKPSVIVNQR